MRILFKNIVKANENGIGLETSKLLKNCGVKSNYYFIKDFSRYGDGEYYRCNRDCLYNFDKSQSGIHPAYTWGEILWENAEEFFGEFESKKIKCSCGKRDNKIINRGKRWHAKEVLELLLQKKYKEADAYFRKNCILIKK